MQATTPVLENESNLRTNLGLGVGIFVCFLLFGMVISRMGLLNSFGRGEETAVSLSPNTLH